MRHAFTLIELLVTVTLLAIMATMVVPVVAGGNDSVRVPSVARMVMADLMYIQNSAITQQKKTWVMFADDKQSYTVVSTTGAAPTNAPTASQAANPSTYTQGQILKQPTTQSGYFVTFGSGAPSPQDRAKILTLTIDGGGTVFGYDALGTPIDKDGNELMAPVVITVSSHDETVKTTLNITPLTGEIEVN